MLDSVFIAGLAVLLDCRPPPYSTRHDGFLQVRNTSLGQDWPMSGLAGMPALCLSSLGAMAAIEYESTSLQCMRNASTVGHPMLWAALLPVLL
jgi:hypothetical protein